ncbi:SGNH/GDSL hydrolase family protein [Stieleria mannarensis]|uniref:SGNH/GDSL hydrolase family protein n=1 Tax=Stieleria mannarensis TaxID=2755585 RepID=UPI0016039156|nr:SGNH/GDSL hydrolase family protein [Rhodopirellula sp. JC639]
MPDRSTIQTPTESTPPKLSTRRVWLFRLACIALAVLPLVAAELYLRATQSVDAANLTRDPVFDTSGQSSLFVKSDDSSRWMIPESRLNFFRPASFAAVKAANVRRIFVLGGSTVQGRPYETETAFAKWMQLRLQAQDPSHVYEVVNCGGVSYASYRVAIILDEILAHSPDAIVLYTGHNEFLEERSYNTIAWQHNPLQRLAQSSYLVRSLRRRLRPQTVPSQELSPALQTRLDNAGGMERYVRDDQWRRGVAEHFRVTLQRMIGMCAAAEVPLLLCVPTSDVVKTPPFKVLAAELDDASLAEFQHHRSIAQDPSIAYEQRIAACDACLKIDPEHAGAHYLAGRLHWENGRSRPARAHLYAARDHDVCPLRATTPIINIVLQLAQRHRLEPIRCDQLFDQTDSQLRPLPDGIEDPQRFADHIHPTIAGHQEIAHAVSDSVMALFQIHASGSGEEAYRRRAAEHLDSLDETYYARGKQRLEGLKNWAAGRAGKLSLEPE